MDKGVRQLRNMFEKCVGEMRIFRWMSGNTLSDGLRNECFCRKIATIYDKLKEND